MLAVEDGGAVPTNLCETLSGRLMPRDRSPIEDTTFDNPIERQKEAKTGRRVGRQALITAVAISTCDHVRAGSKVPIQSRQCRFRLFSTGSLREVFVELICNKRTRR